MTEDHGIGAGAPGVPRLHHELIRGGRVLALAAAARSLIELGATFVLARLISPSDFGLVGMVVAFTGFLDLFKDLGLSTVAVQRQDLGESELSALFWLNLAFGAVLALLLAALAPVLSWGYGEPALTAITLVLGLTLFLGSTPLQHQAQLRRALRFDRLALVETLGSVAATTCSIAAAYAGLGVWSLVLRQLVRAPVSALATFALVRWWPGWPRGARARVRELLRSGGHITGFQISNYIERNLDNVLIGKFAGAFELGCYTRAYELLRMPLAQIGGPVSTLALPALSRLAAEPARYREAYLRLLRPMLLLTIPLCPFLVLCADWVIALAFGPQWGAAVTMFQCLGVAMLTKPIAFTASWLFVSQGRTRELLRWGVWATALAVLAFAVGLPWGATGVALAYAVLDVGVRAPLLFYWVGKDGPVSALDMVLAGRAVWFASALSAAALIVLRRVLGPDVSPWQGATLAALLTIVSTAFGMLLTTAGRQTLTDLRVLFRPQAKAA